MRTLTDRLDAALERFLPDRRVFIRANDETRFVRLRPVSQAAGLAGAGLLLLWAIAATAMLMVDSLGAGTVREQARREQALYEARLNDLAAERDRRAAEAQAAHERFGIAMERVSDMQSALLASEQRRMELETGIETIQATLRRTLDERDAARDEAAAAAETLAAATGARSPEDQIAEAEELVEVLTAALDQTADQRDEMAEAVIQTTAQLDHITLEARLMADRNERIFRRLEEAVSVSMEPLDDMFREAGLSPEQIIEQVRQGYAQNPALAPITISTSGALVQGSDEARAEALLDGLRRIDLYQQAVARLPFAEPIRSSVRFTSGFGVRRDPRTGGRRMHNGVDWAGPSGTPIYATADGVVETAERQSGYGNLVVIRHAFGVETYYAHLSRIRVNVGDRVSRGDRIGDMGSTGRSTGVHLHYEIRVGGRPINPMTYIRAARDVL